MTEDKKPIILIIDDFADENFVRNNIKNLAEKLGFNADEIAAQVKVITEGKEALEFIEKAKNDKQPIAMAFIDNSMEGKHYGLRFAEEIKTADSSATVVWISSEPLSEMQMKYLQEEGFSRDDKLMFNDGLSGSLKHFLLNGDLSRLIEMDKHPMRDIAIPAMKKAFQQIAPQEKKPSDVALGANSIQNEIERS